MSILSLQHLKLEFLVSVLLYDFNYGFWFARQNTFEDDILSFEELGC